MLENRRGSRKAMSTTPNGTPVSKAELQAELQALADKLMEAMRDMQTELLRGFEPLSATDGDADGQT
jgi:hypothetical protein